MSASKTTTTSVDTARPKSHRTLPEDNAAAQRLQEAILHPGSVKINVKGAFIVDEQPAEQQNGNGDTNGNNGNGAPFGGGDGIHYEHKDIRLPHHTDVVSHVAVDIGGSLAKLVYFSPELGSSAGGGRLNFLNFETERIDLCIEFLKQLKENHRKLNGSAPGPLYIMATGGGAYKYYDRLREELGVDIIREDEMECLIIGLDFFITEIPNEVFTYSDTSPMEFCEARTDVYPYLLVNIGSGVSMVKVSAPRQFERVGGTSLGGGTFWGLMSLLTGARTFDEMLGMAEQGDNSGVDMLVGDIYGTDYSKIGLKSSTIASTFGKVFKMKRLAERSAEDGEGLYQSDTESERDVTQFRREDISRSLLFAISNNIGQIAYLQSEKHQIKHIYFGGSFIRGHRQTMNTLSYAIRFWSKGEKQAYFLRHEGYLGAVGAFLKRQPQDWGRRKSLEHAAASRFAAYRDELRNAAKKEAEPPST